MIFAWVPNNHIRHAGKIIGFNGPMRLLSSAGVRGFQRCALWVPVTELVPYEDVKHLPQAFFSLPQKEKRKRANNSKKRGCRR